jgi:hypothetical protein
MFLKILFQPMHQSTPGATIPAGRNRMDHQAGGGSQAPQAVASGEGKMLGVGHIVLRQVAAGSVN